MAISKSQNEAFSIVAKKKKTPVADSLDQKKEIKENKVTSKKSKAAAKSKKSDTVKRKQIFVSIPEDMEIPLHRLALDNGFTVKGDFVSSLIERELKKANYI